MEPSVSRSSMNFGTKMVLNGCDIVVECRDLNLNIGKIFGEVFNKHSIQVTDFSLYSRTYLAFSTENYRYHQIVCLF